jgi:hypothetical protein
MNRLKALYRSWAIPCGGKEVYAQRYRAEWLGKISEAGVRRRAEHYYQCNEPRAWEGGLRDRDKYLATVDCATAIPNLSSSP